jgi:co-chaperonin GroES (HSP10)
MANRQSIEPIGDRVVVERRGASNTTPGGIALPDNAIETPRIGTVIAVGPGALRFSAVSNDGIVCDRYPMQCNVGDRVLLPHHAEIIRLDPKDAASEVVICQESSLLAILR